MIDPAAAGRILGIDAVDPDGRRLGQVAQVYLDDRTGRPEWAAVLAGPFGTQAAIVPLTQAELMGSSLRVPYDKATIDDAPRVDMDHGQLTPEDETGLHAYYGIRDGLAAESSRGTGTGPSTTADSIGPDGTGHPAGHATMTRSEEQLQVSTQWVQTERVRVRKVIVTEDVTVTVPVSHEEIRVEREPVTGESPMETSGPSAPHSEQREFVLYAQRPVVTTEIVPVERVRLNTVTVTEAQTVSDSLRKEQITVDTDLPPGPDLNVGLH
ncbi:conserved protein of unknown function [Modestobacter italicus]|uniref:DUF2382 domain-containing protein n=1 Tax=Modestobacter italicus (strain DSM 44449 / CECT 9708 / BC 501) TaxID=2732864 RepID=I4F0J5_MODI5|nr:YsnF/AvaK domain-containing protein [Modestobacter marinus]CCH89158.1 conserved protein of unknown function [Modestobacter marinus]